MEPQKLRHQEFPKIHSFQLQLSSTRSLQVSPMELGRSRRRVRPGALAFRGAGRGTPQRGGGDLGGDTRCPWGQEDDGTDSTDCTVKNTSTWGVLGEPSLDG